MSIAQLKQLTDAELQQLWMKFYKAFEGKKVEMPRIGILSLSRETKRRNLELEKNVFGDIILKPVYAN